ncbi:MAG: carboxypeptidase-like regulatory domain-containing protein, partial [Prevotellaceae bacterium]|nr:carboxypeptidase-like regulatory domain-containing protein [Prevotellaceae bacterium]
MKTLLKVVNLNMFRTIVTVFFMCGYSITLFAQGKITGKVSDEAGNPLAGVSVVLKGTNNGISTGTDGSYSIRVTGADDVLVFSLVGFVQQEIVAGSKTTIDVVLSEETTELEEVVVLGYGAQARKADLSASIGTIANIEAVKQRPATGVAAMLQGQIPGVTVRNETGNPGSGPSIIIRGKGSRKDEGVLTVVDGIPGGNYVVDEIENVVVLKDAASAAIYGAQAGSAGVILITTKKAKKGSVQVSYDGTFGVNTPYNLPQSLTAEEQIRVRTASHKAAGASLPPGWDPTLNPNIATTRTDFVNLVFRNALFQRHTIAFSGGTDAMTNRLSFNLISNEGTILNTYSKNMQIRYNGSFQPVKWIKVSEDAYFVTYSSHGTTAANGYDGTLQRALNMPRSAAAYNPDGTIGGVSTMDQAYIDKYGQFSGIHGDIMSPLRGLIDNTETRRPIEVRSSTFLEISNIIEGLKLTSRFTYHLYDNLEKIFEPIAPEPGKPRMGNTLSYKRNRDTDWNSETTLNFDRTFDKHSVGALA